MARNNSSRLLKSLLQVRPKFNTLNDPGNYSILKPPFSASSFSSVPNRSFPSASPSLSSLYAIRHPSPSPYPNPKPHCSVPIHPSPRSSLSFSTSSPRASLPFLNDNVFLRPSKPSIYGHLSPPSHSPSSFGVWFVAGAIPVCFLSLTSEASAKERVQADRLPQEVILYQYEACPFCNKVRAYLDYRDIPYKVVEVNPIGKKELKWSEYKKVPVLMVDDVQYNDSSAIITSLETRFKPSSGVKPEQEDEEDRWRKWVDNHLVHLLAPNIYRNSSEALEAFDYITTSGKFTSLERATAKYVGAISMYFISKKLKKRHNIDNERESIYKAANEWVEAIDGRDFLGGDKPNLADLAVFGVLRPIRHMTTGRDLMANTSIGDWYSRMEDAVGTPSRVDS